MTTTPRPSALADSNLDASAPAQGARSSSGEMAAVGAVSDLAGGESGEGAPSERGGAAYSLGDSFMKFELRAELGHGGQAVVLEGYDAFLDRTVAIKFIAPRDEKMRQTLARRARAEARVLSRLEHENVVRVFDAGPTSDGGVYIVMERLYGQTLRAALRQRGRLRIPEALTLGIQISRGVSAAHATGAIHRDLKPENVFIEAGNRVKVVDFGIAKVLGDDINTTQRDRVHGTVLYMSPEHLKGLPVTPQSDVYALGTMLYEALYRHPALLDGRPKEWLQVALFQVEQLPTPLDEVDPAFPHYLSRILQRATAKEPEVRYPTMSELRGALEQALERYTHERQRFGVGVVIEDLSLVRQRDDAASSAPSPSVPPAQARSSEVAALHNHPTVPLSDCFPGGAPQRRPSGGRTSRPSVAAHALGALPSLEQDAIPTRTSRGPAAADAAEADSRSSGDASSARPQRSPRLAVAAGAMVLLGLGIFGAFVLGRHVAASDPPRASAGERAPSAEAAPRLQPSGVPTTRQPLRGAPPVPAAHGPSTLAEAASGAGRAAGAAASAGARPAAPEPTGTLPVAASANNRRAAKAPRASKKPGVRPVPKEALQIEEFTALYYEEKARKAQEAASAAVQPSLPGGAATPGPASTSGTSGWSRRAP